MKNPRAYAILFLLVLGLFGVVAITPVAADAVMTISEFQISTDPAEQSEPDIDDLHIVWQDNRNGNWDIYLYTLMSTQAPETRITNNTSDQQYPAISGNHIVWQDNRNGNWDIYLYDIGTQTETRITTSTANEQYPAISGNRIVWQDDRNVDPDIYMFDLSNQTEKLLSRSCYPGSCPSRYPAIYGDHILYQKMWAPIYTWEPCLFKVDPATRSETLLSAYCDDINPDIAIYENRVVWTVNEDLGKGWHTFIWIYDLNTGSMKRLTNDWQATYDTGHPDTHGYAPAYVVYYNNRNTYWAGNHYVNNDDIFVNNLDLGVETQVTNNTSDQRKPAIYDGRIVWQDYRNGNWDIYMAMLGWSTTDTPPTPEPSETGSLYVASYPSGATILINGTERGQTNQVVSGVTAGMHNLTLVKDGYQPYTTMVRIPANDVKVLPPITLSKGGPSPAGTGTLYIASYPTNATILINGTSYGKTNQFVRNVPAGNQNLTLTRDGYKPYTTTVTVPAGGLKVLAPVTLSPIEQPLGCTCPCLLGCLPGTCMCIA